MAAVSTKDRAVSFTKPAPVMKDYLTTTRASGQAWRGNTERPMTLDEARRIAFDMHAKQTDKSGRPYREHLSAVEQGVVVLGGSSEERVAALFHDAVEDDHTTLEHLRALGATETTLTIIEAVSKRKNEEQGKYLARIIEAGHGAARVKVADLMHNTRHDRMEALRAKGQGHTVDRLLKKYRPALASLMLELGLLTDEDGQKKLATKPIGTAGGYTGGTGGSASYPVKQLMRGDWPKTASAPIVAVEHGNGSSTFTLANGELVTTPWRAKGKEKWVGVHAGWRYGTGPAGVSPEALKDYRAAVDKARGTTKGW